MSKKNEKLKGLTEQRANLQNQMQSLTDTAEAETRAFTEEEASQFDTIEGRIRALDETIDRLQRAQTMANTEQDDGASPADPDARAQTIEQAERRAFEAYLRGREIDAQTRADSNWTTSANGAVIPSTIANKIIDKVKDICPVFQMATHYDIGGTVSIPYYDETSGTISCSYASEFTELTGSSGKFGSIELTGYLAGALSKIPKSLINNSQFDIVSFVVNKMAEKVAAWIEKELLNGTSSKVAGLSGVTQKVTAASATAVTADELIDLQESIPDAYQGSAVFVMNRATRAAIRKLKDSDGDFLLNRDLSSQWNYTLLGKPVYCSDNMPTMAAGKTAIYYGDLSGLAVKVSENPEIQILLERYAAEHAVGVITWLELDSKVENAQKIAALTMKAS